MGSPRSRELALLARVFVGLCVGSLATPVQAQSIGSRTSPSSPAPLCTDLDPLWRRASQPPGLAERATRECAECNGSVAESGAVAATGLGGSARALERVVGWIRALARLAPKPERVAIRTECVREAMDAAPAGFCFGVCGSDLAQLDTAQLPYWRSNNLACADQLVTFVRKPCVSDAAAELMTRAFNQVAGCLQIDVREWFPILAHESGFHAGAMSTTGAAGVGQLVKQGTETAIVEAQRLGARLSERRGCSGLQGLLGELAATDAERLTPFRPETPVVVQASTQAATQRPRRAAALIPARCYHIGSHDGRNPWRSLLLSGLFYQWTQSEAVRLAASAGVTRASVSPAVQQQMGRLAYNVGSGGWLRILRGWLAHQGGRLRPQYGADPREFRSGLRAYLQTVAVVPGDRDALFPSERRKAEVMGYLGAVAAETLTPARLKACVRSVGEQVDEHTRASEVPALAAPPSGVPAAGIDSEDAS